MGFGDVEKKYINKIFCVGPWKAKEKLIFGSESTPQLRLHFPQVSFIIIVQWTAGLQTGPFPCDFPTYNLYPFMFSKYVAHFSFIFSVLI